MYHAGTVVSDGLRTAGGRVLGVTAVAPRLAEARSKAYEAASRIEFSNKMMRTDIGVKGLAAEQRLYATTMEANKT